MTPASSPRSTRPLRPGSRRFRRGRTGDPVVGIVMGSDSDFETMQYGAEALDALGVPHEVHVVSAHRTPRRMVAYAEGAARRGLRVIIAGAGGAAHLPGMLAALTTLPVLGVPVESPALRGLDSLLSIVQMPAGVPTASFAIGRAGAVNAALFAAQILALDDTTLQRRLTARRAANARAAMDGDARIQTRRTPSGGHP